MHTFLNLGITRIHILAYTILIAKERRLNYGNQMSSNQYYKILFCYIYKSKDLATLRYHYNYCSNMLLWCDLYNNDVAWINTLVDGYEEKNSGCHTESKKITKSSLNLTLSCTSCNNAPFSSLCILRKRLQSIGSLPKR